MGLKQELTELASNLWWSWDTDATALWPEIDSYRWRSNRSNPVALLADLESSRWKELEADSSFCERVRGVVARQRAYLASDGWCAEGAETVHKAGVTYLSMEFGLHESLRLYSGGLGVLAGDHIRSASDLGVPLVGFSLLWSHGYFRQLLEGGVQLAAYPAAEFDRLPVSPVVDEEGQPLEVVVPVGTGGVVLRIWRLQVGRCSLYLLDSDHDGNPEAHRSWTRHLYGGDEETRIVQEVLLGLGSLRAQKLLGIETSVVHLNEGHCAFAVLQIVAEGMETGLTFEEALAESVKRCVFTTHTPVPAGHDRFHWGLVNRVLGPWRDAIGLPKGTLMDLGRETPGDLGEALCMTVLAIRGSAATNGVSALHGAVSREMWTGLWPELPVDDVPIGHVTNGVHPVFWMAAESRALFDAELEPWRENAVWDESVWAGVDRISDEALWALRNTLRAKLVDEVAKRSRARLDPNALTIGFARRFAPYKRGALIFSEPDRLEALLKQGVQLVFSGKAHPRDIAGQEIVKTVIRFSERREFRNSVVLLEDYDIALGRLLTQGADVWLNNPRRPKEASGTSGQKVCLNGGLNLSTLDGWWPEGFNGTNGWDIGGGVELPTHEAQDAHDLESLYTLLESSVLPTWLEREDGIPKQWLAMVRSCIRSCAPKFSSHRMVRDYVLDWYAPRC